MKDRLSRTIDYVLSKPIAQLKTAVIINFKKVWKA